MRTELHICSGRGNVEKFLFNKWRIKPRDMRELLWGQSLLRYNRNKKDTPTLGTVIGKNMVKGN